MTTRNWLYGLLTAGLDEDLPHYTTGASPILELGCGLGRVLIPCAKTGSDCVGIDIDNTVIESLKVQTQELHNVQLIHADMCHFSLEQSFAQIQIPLRSFQLLPPENWSPCLICCAKHLMPDGKLIIHLSPGKSMTETHAWRTIGTRESTDGGWFLIEESTHNTDSSTILCHRVSHVLTDTRTHQQWILRHHLNHMTLEELKSMLLDVGLEYSTHKKLGKDLLVTAVHQS